MSSETASGSSASKSLLWMTIGLFAGMGVLLIGGFFTAKRVLSSMSLGAMATSRDNMAMPHGRLRLENQNQVGPGLPVYPNSSLELPDNQSASAGIRDARQGIEIAKYHSPDLRDAVESWYREHLGTEFLRHGAEEQPGPPEFKQAHVTDSDVAFVAQRGEQIRIVALSQDDNGTTISLVSINKAEPAGEAPSSAPPAPSGQSAPAPASAPPSAPLQP